MSTKTYPIGETDLRGDSQRQEGDTVSGNEQRAADYLGHLRCQSAPCPDCRDLAAAFDLAEARGRADLAAVVRELAETLKRPDDRMALYTLADEADPSSVAGTDTSEWRQQ